MIFALETSQSSRLFSISDQKKVRSSRITFEKDLLRQKPRDPKQGILTKSFSALMLGQGALIAVVTLISFYIGLQTSPAVASTMAFATLGAFRFR